MSGPSSGVGVARALISEEHEGHGTGCCCPETPSTIDLRGRSRHNRVGGRVEGSMCVSIQYDICVCFCVDVDVDMDMLWMLHVCVYVRMCVCVYMCM